MAKQVFLNGDYVKAKKWSGESFLGILEYTYDDGSHCVVDVTSSKRFNVLKGDLKHASEEETKEIKNLAKQNNIRAYKKDNSTKKKETDKKEKEEELELEAALQASEE